MIHFRSIDEQLPKCILDATQNVLSMLGSIVLSIAVNPYLIVPVLLLSILFMLTQKVYLKTSKNLKRLEGIGKLYHTDK